MEAQNENGDDVTTSLSIQYCQQAVDELDRLADDLQRQITTARKSLRTIAKLKVTFKKDTIRGYQERLQFSMQMLSLSQQTHLISIYLHSLRVFEVTQARIQLPGWLSNRAWDYEVHKTCMGWRFSLKPWNTRPFSTPVFKIAHKGLLPQLVEAFDGSEAFPFDRDPSGRTLLHVSFGLLTISFQLQPAKTNTNLGSTRRLWEMST
ncbi:hypothetical protein CMUS01_12144 [Colletotrichum musicola]|uniref:Uncharacterized protein n=1 Tax=Colletotrichum musicola TaxID=2175873 RepID=A0A8H6N2K4_9PEZI|nr:hypothetical protein CMUS01_12144 [Colletotrichum musicola]